MVPYYQILLMSASWLLYAIYNRVSVRYYGYVFIWWFIEVLSVDFGIDADEYYVFMCL